MSRKRVLVVFPNAWDVKQLESCRAEWEPRFELLWGEPSAEDCPADTEPEQRRTPSPSTVRPPPEKQANESTEHSSHRDDSDRPGTAIRGHLVGDQGLADRHVPGLPGSDQRSQHDETSEARHHAA